MSPARSSAYQGSRLKKPNASGILNNRERCTKATSTWYSSASKIPSTTMFDCLFCHHKDSVVVKLDKKSHRGELTCKLCGQHFQIAGPLLYDPVDVHAAWIDACDAVKEQAEKERVERQQKALKPKKKAHAPATVSAQVQAAAIGEETAAAAVTASSSHIHRS